MVIRDAFAHLLLGAAMMVSTKAWRDWLVLTCVDVARKNGALS